MFIPFDVLIAGAETIGAEFFEITLGPIAGTYIVPIFVGFSMWITCACNIFVFGRSLEATARENLFPFRSYLEKRNRFNMPHYSASIVSLVAILFTIGMPNGNGLNFLIDAASFPHWISTAIVIGTLIYIKLFKPEIISPYTSWIGSLILFFIGAIFVIVFPMLQNTSTDDYDSRLPIGVMIVVILLGFLIYLRIRKPILEFAFRTDKNVEKKAMSKSTSINIKRTTSHFV